MRLRLLLIPLVAAGAVLGAPSAAQGVDYCVGSPAGCTGMNMGTDLQGALDQAAMSTTVADRVLIGPGTYSRANGFDYDQGANLNTVEVRGVGSPKPTLVMPTAVASESTLTLIQTGSVVDNLAIVIPNLPGNLRGLFLGRATARNLTVTGSASVDNLQFGVQMTSTGNVLTNSTIDISTTLGAGVYDLTAGGSLIADNTITALRGIDIANSSGTGAIRRNRISASQTGISMYFGDYDVDNTLIDLRGGPGEGIAMGTVVGNLSNTVDASQLTIRNGDGSSVGIRQSDTDPGATEAINLRDSIIRDVGRPIFQDVPGAGAIHSVTSTNNSYDASLNLPMPPDADQIRTETNVANTEPGFMNPVLGVNGLSGDYRLAFDSAVIDAGTATPLLMGGETDLSGLPRIVDGAAPFSGATRDLGAYEYQPPAATPNATAPPAIATSPPATCPTTKAATAAAKKKKKKKPAGCAPKEKKKKRKKR